jgi:hypothetical protein
MLIPTDSPPTVGTIEGQIGHPRFQNSIDAVDAHPECDQLTLADLSMCPRTILTLTELLVRRRRWKRLLLWGCHLNTDAFLDALVDAAAVNRPPVCFLGLDGSLLIEEIEIRSLCNLDEVVAAAIGRLLAASQSLQLKRFTLSIATISARSMKALVDQASILPSKTIGDGNRDESEHVEHVYSVPIPPAITLTSIRFSCCTFGTSEMVSWLAQLLHRLDALEALRIDSCRVPDQDMAILLNALKGHSHLREIAIPYNKCQAATMRALAELLRKPDCSIQSLDCSRQYPGDGGESDPEIENDDDEEGNDDSFLPMDDLMPALEQNTSLVTLDLSHSRIRCPMWIRIIELYLGWSSRNIQTKQPSPLSSSTTRLRSLILCGVPIPPAALWSLISTLPNCSPSLRRLWLTGAITSSTMSSMTRRPSSLHDPIRSSLLENALVDALRENWALHDILLPLSFSPVLRRYVQYYTDLNRAGRSLLRQNDSTAVPAALWPLVLERAAQSINSTNSGAGCTGNYLLRPTSMERFVNVSFHLLRNGVLLGTSS